MKKLFAILLCLSLVACGHPMEYNGKTYPTYGLINADTNKSKDMCYEVSVGNSVLSFLLVETIVAPMYFLGWSIMNPAGPVGSNGKCGIDAN